MTATKLDPTVDDADPRDVLLMHLAAVIPSEAAISSASLEWKVIREAWLRCLDMHGVTETEMREGWRGAHWEAILALAEAAR